LPGTLAPQYGQRDYLMRRALAVTDMLAIAGSAALAMALSPAQTEISDFLWVLPTLPVWVLLFRLYGLYERDVKRLNHGALDDVPNLFHALAIGTLMFWVYVRLFQGAHRLVLLEVLVLAAAALVLVLALRSLARRVVSRLMGPERVVFLGEVPSLPALVRKIQMHPEYCLEPVGIVQSDIRGRSIPSLPVLGDLDGFDLSELVRRYAVERVIVAHAEVEDAMLLELLQQCGPLSVKVSVLPRYVDALGPSVEVDEIEGVTVLDLNPLILPRFSRVVKRATDVVGAGVALIFFAPLMALLALAIRLDSTGPVLFRQERVGRRGQHFELLKFRTMVPDAERHVEELLKWSQDPHWLKLDRDPRVTRMGRVLRLFSLDEIPQLFNVVKGEMSLVGPRPLLPSQDVRVAGWSRMRLELAPGITGLWQVLGRTNIPFEEMLKLDTVYVTNWSLWLDIKLILRTFRIVLTRQGSN
jgi:exopolysaccharide biosynthesis polyprenyl glycosylphosphotransferase